MSRSSLCHATLQVDDIDGTALYGTLQLHSKATSDDIKKVPAAPGLAAPAPAQSEPLSRRPALPRPSPQAYRSLARLHHPDKGGDPALFGLLQHAYEVLSDPRRRAVYDTWAKELQFRYVRPATAQPQGGEDVLLDEFESLGLRCDAATQLVVTCGVCRRPATKACWTCGMDICEFCTLKRHWRDGVPLHWPLVNSEHMAERLGRRELERKRVDDAQRLALADPNHRGAAEMADIRAFREAAEEAVARGERLQAYDLRLARHYMWAQTPTTVFLACRVPTGFADTALTVACAGGGLLVQTEGELPLIDRAFDGAVDASVAVETLRTEDNRVCALAVAKGAPGEAWARLFRGDPDGARCLEPPYSVFEAEEEVVVQIELPFWIDADDVRVEVGPAALGVHVRNTLALRRAYWRNAEEEGRRPESYAVVDPEQSVWSLEEDADGRGERCKVLTVTLARPGPTEEEVTWKRGRRQDNTAAARPGGGAGEQRRGYRFFADDEDAFELEEVLQALCFAQAGRAFVPPKPWAAGEEARWASHPAALPPAARALLQRLTQQEAPPAPV